MTPSRSAPSTYRRELAGFPVTSTVLRNCPAYQASSQVGSGTYRVRRMTLVAAVAFCGVPVLLMCSSASLLTWIRSCWTYEEHAVGSTSRVRRQLHVPPAFSWCFCLAAWGVPIPGGNADHRGRRVEPRGDRPVVAGAARLPAGVLSGDMVLYWVGRHWGAADPQLATGSAGTVTRAGAVAEGRVSTACPEDRRHGTARHGTARRRVSDRGQCEASRSGSSWWRTRVPPCSASRWCSGSRTSLSDQIKAIMADVHRAEALARSRWPPGAGDDAGRRRVAMASSRREGASERGTGCGSY